MPFLYSYLISTMELWAGATVSTTTELRASPFFIVECMFFLLILVTQDWIYLMLSADNYASTKKYKGKLLQYNRDHSLSYKCFIT